MALGTNQAGAVAGGTRPGRDGEGEGQRSRRRRPSTQAKRGRRAGVRRRHLARQPTPAVWLTHGGVWGGCAETGAAAPPLNRAPRRPIGALGGAAVRATSRIGERGGWRVGKRTLLSAGWARRSDLPIAPRAVPRRATHRPRRGTLPSPLFPVRRASARPLAWPPGRLAARSPARAPVIAAVPPSPPSPHPPPCLRLPPSPPRPQTRAWPRPSPPGAARRSWSGMLLG